MTEVILLLKGAAKLGYFLSCIGTFDVAKPIRS